MQIQIVWRQRDKRRLKRLWRQDIHANTKLYGEIETKTVETSGGTCIYYTKLYEETVRPKETKETVETNGNTCNYKTVWRDRERLKETVETVETGGDTCKYRIV